MNAKPCSTFANSVNNTYANLCTPQMLKTAYNYPENSSLTGKNVTVSVISAFACNSVKEDLNVYSEAFSLPLPQSFEIVKLSPLQPGNTLWQKESALDTQLFHAFAPQAKLRLYVVGSDRIDKLLKAAELAAKDGADIVCMSFGVAESSFSNNSPQPLELGALLPESAIYVAAAGDVAGVCVFPSSLPCCISVGGTELDISPMGTRLGREKAWQRGGGGASRFFEIETPQNVFRPIPFMSSGMRATPDVAFFAGGTNANNGVAVYSGCLGENGIGGWFGATGTSIGVPVWCAVAALCLEASGRKLAGHKAFSRFLYNLAGGTAYSNLRSAFGDIKVGSNGVFDAGFGFDFCTGLGVPHNWSAFFN